MNHDYQNALKLCQMILIYNPSHNDALQFEPLLKEMTQKGESENSSNTSSEGSSCSSSSNSDEEDDDDDDEEEDEDDDDDDDNCENSNNNKVQTGSKNSTKT
ncbi:glutamate-rich protein 2-like isoform X2 [Octopus bimaculoides]|nr:glutamate-rich protein 2-like isoform X2 [Octopus bimaculoides]XP_052824553.1 glutamate-rich protein 2-like isoform X2 [Octopus bimaculoides]XP_052824554.1 glutamate-rich protein 2-like isoform X2 [Octopus bimaculoides]|eukprot:XP_014788413.1 PREDICTED: glutamate-rich protein 2-like isoform X2 [Octopus bimaculoides]